MHEIEGPKIGAIDLFSGAGGLSLGLKQSGVDVIAGFDLDQSCAYPYTYNLKSEFFQADINDIDSAQLNKLWEGYEIRLLAGCAPCQPFSSHRRGADTSGEGEWNLLAQFQRLVHETLPEYVTMENVARLEKMDVFHDFLAGLEHDGYSIGFEVLRGQDFGLPQTRRRLVLVASKLGAISLPTPKKRGKHKSVRSVIGKLRPLEAGESDPNDPLHVARNLSPLNLERIKASKPGGTWEDWPEELLANCHKKPSGASFKSFYGRMSWDLPSPTITTQSHNFGSGRFGHPEQDRTLTLREMAILQGFPRSYRFTKAGEKVTFTNIGRMIGNAVPPPFGKAVGEVIIAHAVANRAKVVGGVEQ